FLVEVQGGNSFERQHVVLFVGMGRKHLLVLFNGQLGIVVVLRGIDAGNILPYVGCSQIELGNTQIRIEGNRVLEFLDGVFVFSALVGLHTFVELVARFELVASRGCH